MKDKAGNTCLHYAAQGGFHDVIERLLQAVPPDCQQLLDVTNNVCLQFVYTLQNLMIIYMNSNWLPVSKRSKILNKRILSLK